jgi:hypothetical protein
VIRPLREEGLPYWVCFKCVVGLDLSHPDDSTDDGKTYSNACFFPRARLTSLLTIVSMREITDVGALVLQIMLELQ